MDCEPHADPAVAKDLCHLRKSVLRLCDPVAVMAEGKNLAKGSFREVAENPTVQEAYMGRRKHG
mgnify:CR=1 FL=1